MSEQPVVVCLCGSTRFYEAFQKANLAETLAGHIVLSVGCYGASDAELGITPETKAMLDELHLRKIDMCDEVLILNVDGYIGPSTWSELCYAVGQAKRVRFLDRKAGAERLQKVFAAFEGDSSPPALCGAVYETHALGRKPCVLAADHQGHHVDISGLRWAPPRALCAAVFDLEGDDDERSPCVLVVGHAGKHADADGTVW